MVGEMISELADAADVVVVAVVIIVKGMAAAAADVVRAVVALMPKIDSVRLCKDSYRNGRNTALLQF